MKYNIQVPYFVDLSTYNGEQYLKTWVDDKPSFVKPPFNPRLYVNGMDTSSERFWKSETKTLKRMSTHSKGKWDVLTFKNTKARDEFQSAAVQNDIEAIKYTPNFVDEVVQHSWHFFKRYQTSVDLRVLTFDIEQKTDGSGKFPTKDVPLLSIAWKCGDNPVQCIMTDGEDDREVVSEFAKVWEQYDPHVIVTFNGNDYDIPVLKYKFAEYGLGDSMFSRDPNKTGYYEYKKKIGPRHVECISSSGILYFDVYHAALTDQTLHGISKGLKSVAKEYKRRGMPIDIVVEEDMKDNRKLIGTQKLVDYNVSDVNATHMLFDMYFDNTVAIANFIGAPLNKLVPLATSYPFTQVMGNKYLENGLIPDANSIVKYPWAFEVIDRKTGKVRPLKDDESVFQGALTDTFKVGLFKNVKEFDVTSLYPSIMIGLGIAPDNTRLIGKIDEVVDFEVIQDDDVRIFYVPDEKRGWTWIIQVVGVSTIAKTLKDFKDIRTKLKDEAKAEGDKMKHAQAYGLKVCINSAYGITGAGFSEYGDIAVAALVTALGRIILTEGMRFCGMEYVTNCDTDGFKTMNLDITEDDINNHFNEFVKTLTCEPEITWEEELFDAVYTTTANKNYLLKSGDEYTIHGASLKSTRAPGMINRIVQESCKPLLDGVDPRELKRKYLDMSQYTLSDYAMSIRLSKNPENMKSANTLSYQIAMIAQSEQGIKAKAGNSYDYLKVKEVYGKGTTDLNGVKYRGPVGVKYALLNDDKLEFVDNEFYTERINNLFETLGVVERKEQSVQVGLWG